jgi:periplasmic protein TonB
MAEPAGPRLRALPALAVVGLHGLVGAAMWSATMPADEPHASAPQALWVRLAAPDAGPPPAERVPLPVPDALPPPAASRMAPPEVSLLSMPVQEPTITAPTAPTPATPLLQAYADTARLPSSPAPAAGPGAASAAAPDPATAPARATAAGRRSADHRTCGHAPYPAALRERGIQGELTLRVHVTPDGRAAEVQLLASSGWRLFDEAALAQVRSCRFRPARADGQAVADWVEFPVKFRLDG